MIPIAFDSSATITVYLADDVGRTQLGEVLNSGDISVPISLKQNTINHLVVEINPSVVGEPTVEYPLYLRYQPQPTVSIASLEDLNAIRNQLDGIYSLSRKSGFPKRREL